MKKRFICFLVILSLLILPGMTAASNTGGVDDLRGQWVFNWTFESGETPFPFLIYINKIIPSLDTANVFLAAGCMKTPYLENIFPLSLSATFDPETSSYALTLYSTFIPADEYGSFGPPILIRFTGDIMVNGSGVSDDQGYGEFQSNMTNGTWQGTHHDRRYVDCQAMDLNGERLNMDITAHMDVNGGDPVITHYQLEANAIMIAASALQVTTPDGQVFIIPQQASMWAPGVDFINEFRFGQDFEGSPISGQPYQFVLLDILGNPIPGTETVDTWTHCVAAAPGGYQFTPNPANGEDVFVAWTGVPDVPGEFVPGEIGFYQLGFHPENWEGSAFGADSMAVTNHVLPWTSFVPDDPGTPDGRNVGVALGEFLDGPYLFDVSVSYEANPIYGGFGHECGVNDSMQAWRMEKTGDSLIFAPNQ
ncbi:MAG: hypothetical protein C0410_09195 [Anaerolinea sp.]|nr:hypothetical protein [Anaerolinea sp.]